jgi:hypothetical protein
MSKHPIKQGGIETQRDAIWHNNLLSKCYFICGLLAWALLFFSFVVGEEADHHKTGLSLSLLFAIVLTSPVPTMVIGSGLRWRCGWARWAGIALPFLQGFCLLKVHQLQSGGTPLYDLDWQSSLVFYLCQAQNFYLPGCFVLGIYLAWFTFSKRGRVLYSKRA